MKQQINQQADVSTQNYLPEVKQFMSFFSIHFYVSLHNFLYIITDQRAFFVQYQKRMTDAELKLKQRMSSMYSTMLLQEGEDSEMQLMGLFRDTLTTESMPSNILKAALRTIKKLLEYPEYTRKLTAQGF